MAVDSRAKGARVETTVRDLLRKLTNLQWERVPMSGALSPVHGLKADLYIPNSLNIYSVEVKGYKEDHLTSKLLTSKNPQFLEWWIQTKRQAAQISRKPLLIFKFDRSKIFVAYEDVPTTVNYIYLEIDGHSVFVSLLEEWIFKENPRFV